jgi:mannose-6-phosphate isomerase-like protein (cupin superfamily)
VNDSGQISPVTPQIIRVPCAEDRFGKSRSLGVSTVSFKVTSTESNGLFVLENIFREKGGPPRHLHHEQDEWFYVVEGRFAFEVGQEKFLLGPGDSLLAPQKVPHVWASVGDSGGRILVSFSPAGQMEAFFNEVTADNAMPPQNPSLWARYGMELLGPPLRID